MRLQLDSTALGSAESRPIQQSSGLGQTAGRTPDGARSGDSVGISGTSAALSRLSADRAARIQQLTAAVRNDTYKVPAAALGQAILAQAGV
jgi:anti-sigma28 factor (negative regulator of flagellin synthesis)